MGTLYEICGEVCFLLCRVNHVAGNVEKEDIAKIEGFQKVIEFWMVVAMDIFVL